MILITIQRSYTIFDEDPRK